ncbi:MAG: hypothetical protein ACLS6C_12715 [Clostridia bacterium]
MIKPILEKAGIPFVERDAEQYLQEVTALGLTHAPSLVVRGQSSHYLRRRGKD